MIVNVHHQHHHFWIFLLHSKLWPTTILFQPHLKSSVSGRKQPRPSPAKKEWQPRGLDKSFLEIGWPCAKLMDPEQRSINFSRKHLATAANAQIFPGGFLQIVFPGGCHDNLAEAARLSCHLTLKDQASQQVKCFKMLWVIDVFSR